MIRALILWLVFSSAAFAHDFSGLARIDPLQSRISDSRDGIDIELSLSQPVPYRVFTLADPYRLVVDFREVDWGELIAADILRSDRIQEVRFGVFRPGWSRMVIELEAPFDVAEAGLATNQTTAEARLRIRMTPASVDSFALSAGEPQTPDWDSGPVRLTAPLPDTGKPVLVLDPGHGGIDPGAQRAGVNEADLMLSLGIELADRLNRTGNVDVVLTRNADYFVSLHHRITIARQVKAALMISLHADALEEDQARGASVYTLSKEGADIASQRMAERHEREDLLTGVDLSGQGDRVANVLMDLARAQTSPASDRFADQLVDALKEHGARLNSRPRREAHLAVLTAADFSSVLVEVGFLSSDRDRQQLQTSEGRAPIVAGLAAAIERWVLDEAARQPLLRQ